MNLANQSKNKSFEALFSRGVYSKLSQDLIDSGYNLASLSKLTKEELTNLGLPSTAIKNIHAYRPRVPASVYNSLLFKSRWTCCVCRGSDKEIILHHIKEWAESRDHSENNLVVLCLHCHGKAHSSHQLSLNLGEKQLKSAKKKWECEVSASDARNLAVESKTQDNSHCWYHVNHQRLFAAAKDAGVDFQDIPTYSNMLNSGLVDGDGFLTLNHLTNEKHAYAHGNSMLQYEYVREIISRYLSIVSLDNVSDFLDYGSIRHRIRQGDTIFLQGAFTFKDKAKKDEGLGQERKIRRKLGKIEFVSVIDGWDSTSTSAWGCWLKGRQSAGALLKIRSINHNNNRIKFKCTTLAIAFGLDALKSRQYGEFG